VASREAAIDVLTANLLAHASIKTVLRVDRETSISAQSVPAVLVVDDGAEDIQYKTGGLADVYQTVRLIGVVKDIANLSQSMNALDVVIKTVVAADPTLTGTVAHVTILPQEEKRLNEDDSVAQFTRPVRIFYEASVSGGM